MYIKSWKFSSVERSVCLPVALGCLRDGNYRLGTGDRKQGDAIGSVAAYARVATRRYPVRQTLSMGMQKASLED